MSSGADEAAGMPLGRTPSSLWRQPIPFFAFGLGSGLSPAAPGTVGTAFAAIFFYWGLSALSGWAYAATILVLFLVGVTICERTTRALGVHDHPAIVWDEFVGYFMTMWGAPPGWQWMLAGFVLFRFFDIVKPQPVRWVDRRVQGGLGIMLDDVIAAAYAWLVLQALAWTVGR